MLEVYDSHNRLSGVFESVQDCRDATGLSGDEISQSVLDGVEVRGYTVKISETLLWTITRREICNRQDKLGVKEIARLEDVPVASVRSVLARATKKMRRSLWMAGVVEGSWWDK